MKRKIWSALCLAALLGPAGMSLQAQNKDNANEEAGKAPLKQYDEIIIRKKSDKDLNDKINIEIKDGKVTVNGKPLEAYDNPDLSIRLRSMPRVALTGPGAFRNGRPGGPWNMNEDRRIIIGGNKAFLGVSSQEDHGARIQEVTTGSAAEKAGLKKGDISTGVDDQHISNPQELSQAIGKYEPGDEVSITYLRDGKEIKTKAKLQENKSAGLGMMMPGPEGLMGPGGNMMPEMREFRWSPGNMAPFDMMQRRPRLGIQAQDTENGKGVKVLGVLDESAAAKAGLKEGDVITRFDGKEVNSADQLVDAAHDASDKTSVDLEVTRDGKTMNLTIKTPKRLKTANL